MTNYQLILSFDPATKRVDVVHFGEDFLELGIIGDKIYVSFVINPNIDYQQEIFNWLRDQGVVQEHCTIVIRFIQQQVQKLWPAPQIGFGK